MAVTDAPLSATIRLKFKEYRRGMGGAIGQAIRAANRGADEWKRLYFPLRLGNLRGASGSTIFFYPEKKEFVMRFRSGGMGVDYASIVNAWTPSMNIQWSWPDTRYNYFDEWVKFTYALLGAFLKHYLSRFFATPLQLPA